MLQYKIIIVFLLFILKSIIEITSIESIVTIIVVLLEVSGTFIISSSFPCSSITFLSSKLAYTGSLITLYPFGTLFSTIFISPASFHIQLQNYPHILSYILILHELC